MSRYRGWRLTVFVVSIVIAVFAPSTVAVIVVHLLVETPASASNSGSTPTTDTASIVSRTAEASEQGLTADNAAVTVDVYNTTDVRGLARRVLDELAARGFTPGNATNASTPPSSVVWYAIGEGPAGRRVAEALGGLPVEPDPNPQAGRVRVYLGEDYHGLGA